MRLSDNFIIAVAVPFCDCEELDKSIVVVAVAGDFFGEMMSCTDFAHAMVSSSCRGPTEGVLILSST